MRKRLCYLIIFCLLLSACGRKAPPHLKAFEKPEKVENLKVVHNERGLIFSWSYPERVKIGIRGFVILRSLVRQGHDEEREFRRRGYVEGKDGSFSFIDTDFETDKTYIYRIIAEGIKGVMSDATDIKVTPITLPDPPKKIRFSIKNDLIELTWEDKKACYNVYRSYNGEEFSVLNREPLCERVFNDRESVGRPVNYIIRSLRITDIVNEGRASGKVIVRLEDFIPSPPSDLRIAVGPDRIFLLWRESPETWVRGYRIFRKIDGEKDFKIIGESSIPAFTDSDMRGLEGKKVYYMIKALGPASESGPFYGECLLPRID